ncbi:hypothetical protein [Streptomyces sp. NBC_01235]|nr:hypothetical protein OG289_45685 [Streptomyces sp. NBC_01235]
MAKPRVDAPSGFPPHTPTPPRGRVARAAGRLIGGVPGGAGVRALL